LLTYGFSFHPWKGDAPFAEGGEILKYLQDVMDTFNLHQYIHYHHKVLSATWIVAKKHWRIDVYRSDIQQTVCYITQFLWMCQGYYNHDTPYLPTWPGMENFQGKIIHPQQWTENTMEELNLQEKKEIVVIGSGSTTATLIPAIAPHCHHITMLQRSPSYYLSIPIPPFPGTISRQELAAELTKLQIDENIKYQITERYKRILKLYS
jgi:cation diffusion facilitator CzcD-associated flavoprotein CzcO